MNRHLVFWTFFNMFRFPAAKRIGDSPAHPSLTEEWIAYRYGIWYNNTYQGLRNQTHQDFTYLMLFDKSTMPIINKYFGEVFAADPRIKPIEVDGEWSFVTDINAQLPANCELRFVRNDSDDVWAPHAGATFMGIETDKKFILCEEGLVRTGPHVKYYDDRNGSGPFYCRIFRGDFPGQQWRETPHNYIRQNGCVIAPPGLFLVTVHGANTSTHFNTQECSTQYGPEAALDILKSFHIDPSK